MPLYPYYDDWVEAGVLGNVLKELEMLRAAHDEQFDVERAANEVKLYFDKASELELELDKLEDINSEAFRIKVTSNCKACKMLDDYTRKGNA